MVAIDNLRGLSERIGDELATSDWIEITQARVDAFAETTEDRQWIHVDPDRAARESPYGATIAHGFLTLSLISRMARTAMTFPTSRMAVNYGINRVRFVSAVPVGSRLRARFSPQAVEPIENGVQVTWKATVERDGGTKPACVAEWIVRYFE
jgi:acyl dehydratase